MVLSPRDANPSDDEQSLIDLIERSAELKGELVAFTQSARFDRWLTPILLEAAGPERQLDEGGGSTSLTTSLCSTACRTVRLWWTGLSPDVGT